jgi:hypothetical protein
MWMILSPSELQLGSMPCSLMHVAAVPSTPMIQMPVP